MYHFTSESVSRGHPDKVADQISDLILDYFLSRDKNARVACETLVTPKKIAIGGEFRSNFDPSYKDIDSAIRALITKIGYTEGTFAASTVEIEFLLCPQSEDISMGVDIGERASEGAGDQGIMFGYATDETPEYMPIPIYYASSVLRLINRKRIAGELKGIGVDAKTQATFVYDSQHKPLHLDTFLISIQHAADLSSEDVANLIKPVILECVPEHFITPETKFLFNPTGRFVIGGPESDAGLTGRKIIVDTYGGVAPHGGGAFSGKDPTKVDRSAAYALRYIAKNIVHNKIAYKCLIQASYAIGVPEPISLYVNCFGTGKISNEEIISMIRKNFDLTPRGIINMLDLTNVTYLDTAYHGHFKSGLFPWEKLITLA